MFDHGVSCVYTDVPLILAVLIVLAAVPASAQPSIVAGDWLRIDFRAHVQGDLRTSEAPIRSEAGAVDIAGRRVGIDGRLRAVPPAVATGVIFVGFIAAGNAIFAIAAR